MVVLIPVSVATAFSMSLVPEMTKAYTAGNVKLLYKHFTRTNLLVVGITVPAAIGMMMLAKPVYTLYSAPEMIQRWEVLFYSITPCLYTIFAFTVTAAMLQGINQQQKTVLGLVIGIIVKIVLNIVLLPYFDYVSFIISTYAGYTISVGFNLWMLSKYVIKAT